MRNFFTSKSLRQVAIAAFFLLPSATFASTVTLFTETFGTPTSTKSEAIEDHVWDNSDVTYSWSTTESDLDGDGVDDSGINVRSNNVSDYDGASASGNLYLQGTSSLTISGIDISGYSDLSLSLGVFGKLDNDVTLLTIYITDGDNNEVATYSLADIDASEYGLSTTSASWSYITLSGISTSASSINITLSAVLTDADGGIRVDDLTLAATTDDTSDSDSSSTTSGKSTIFYETFDTPSSSKDEAIEDHVWETNGSSYFSWEVADDDSSINVRSNNASDYEGASGSGNLYFKGYASFTISGIQTNTTTADGVTPDYSNVELSFGTFGKSDDDIKCMTLTITDGKDNVSVYDFSELDDSYGLETAAGTWGTLSFSGFQYYSPLTLTFSTMADDSTDDTGDDSSDTTESTVTLFTETFGTPTSTKSEAIEDHVWDNSDVTYSWSTTESDLDGDGSDDSGINVRSNNVSDYDGASASGNLYLQGTSSLTISGIDISGYTDLSLSLGVFGKLDNDVTLLTIYITDGDNNEVATYSLADIDASEYGLSTTSASWSYITFSGITTSASSINITLSAVLTDADGGIRVDDLTLTATVSSSAAAAIAAAGATSTDVGIRIDDILLAGNEATGITNIISAAQPTYAVSGKTITATSNDIEVYSITGIRVASVAQGESIALPTAGIYILHTGKSAAKVVLK